MKRFITICMTVFFAMVMSLQVFAAKQGTSAQTATRIIPVGGGQTTTIQGHDLRYVAEIELEDLNRLVKVLNRQNVDGKDLGPVKNYTGNNGVYGMKIVNAKQLASNEWVIRIYDQGTQMITGDYLVTARPYETDALGLPYDVPQENEHYNAQYGPAWFFCGLFGDGSGTIRQRKDDGSYEVKSDNHQIIGYAIAQRITRWPAWDDLHYGELPNAHGNEYGQPEFTMLNKDYVATWTDKNGTTWSKNPDEAPGKLKREGHDVDYSKSVKYIFTPTGFARDSAMRLNAQLAAQGKSNPALTTFISRIGTVGLVGSYDMGSSDWQNKYGAIVNE